MNRPLQERLHTTVNELQARDIPSPVLGFVLGSGLGGLADRVEEARRIPYGDLTGFPESTVEGHAGELVLGRLQGRPVAVMSGRYHYYEGCSLPEVTFPVRVLDGLGIEVLVVTNASGGIHPDFEVGDLVLIRDHINLLGDNPLIGVDPGPYPRFVDMTEAYPEPLRELARNRALEQGLDLAEGVYAATTGPSYETPAEVDLLETMGADLVGMSTVPEVIVANQVGLAVLGLSCVTNRAAGRSGEPLDHEDVVQTTETVKPTFESLLRGLVDPLVDWSRA